MNKILRAKDYKMNIKYDKLFISLNKNEIKKFILKMKKSLLKNNIIYINGVKTMSACNSAVYIKYKDISNDILENNVLNELISYSECKRNVEENEYVYVIGNIKHKICKIGFSNNVSERIKGLQTGCPVPLEIIAIVKGNRSIEKSLHKKYKKFKTYGEWFIYDGILKQNIENISNNLKYVIIDNFNKIKNNKKSDEIKLI